jgi:organic hydroperoxide reductase OsmC/OhrA
MENDMNILYSTNATATGGRTGAAKTGDGRLAVTLDTAKELGGSGGEPIPSSSSPPAMLPASSVRSSTSLPKRR